MWRRSGVLSGGVGWAVAAQDLGLVPVAPHGGAVWGADHRPAHPVDHHLMMKPARQHPIIGTSLAAVDQAPQMMHLTRRRRLMTAARPLTETVPHDDRMPERRRERLP